MNHLTLVHTSGFLSHLNDIQMPFVSTLSFLIINPAVLFSACTSTYCFLNQKLLGKWAPHGEQEQEAQRRGDKKQGNTSGLHESVVRGPRSSEESCDARPIVSGRLDAADSALTQHCNDSSTPDGEERVRKEDECAPQTCARRHRHL